MVDQQWFRLDGGVGDKAMPRDLMRRDPESVEGCYADHRNVDKVGMRVIEPGRKGYNFTYIPPGIRYVVVDVSGARMIRALLRVAPMCA